MTTAAYNEYCFGESKLQQCNPNSRAKLSDSGKCVCQDPYTGDLCESCKSGSKSSVVDGHTVCTINSHECNGFGDYKNGKCLCYENFSGDKCERCANETLAYPDCSGDYLKDTTSSQYL